MDTIIQMWSGAGWFALALWVLSVLSWVFIFRIYQKLQNSWLNTSKLGSEISHRIADGQSAHEVNQWLCTKKGVLPRIIKYVSKDENQTKTSLRERYEEASMCEFLNIQREFGLVSSLVKSAPLLGLLGTVAGMIQTFAALSNSGDISTISVGISKALLTTQLGLLIALPGLFALAYLKRRFNRFRIELEKLFYHLIRLREKA